MTQQQIIITNATEVWFIIISLIRSICFGISVKRILIDFIRFGDSRLSQNSQVHNNCDKTEIDASAHLFLQLRTNNVIGYTI